MSDDKIKKLFNKIDDMRSNRMTFERPWQDIRELVRPNTTDFTGGPTPGQVRTTRIYDGTAVDACNELAAGLCAYLVNPSERWFTIGVTGYEEVDYDEDALAWLEIVSEAIYACYAHETSGFNSCMHESMLDIGAFGTSCPYQEWSPEKNAVIFRSCSMSGIYFDEDSGGQVDSVNYLRKWKVRQLRQQFAVLPPKISEEKNENKELHIHHLVCPRTDRDITKADTRNKKFASFWLCEETKELILESGYDTLPYHGGRWMKLADEVYGVGPAKDCLPDIKMLNNMEKTIIKYAQKLTDPPLQVPDEGFMLPIDTSPGSLIFKEGNSPLIEPLYPQGQVPWSLELAEQKRNKIRKTFLSDWLKMEKENKEMTAYEVADRRNEKLQLIAPNMGRIQKEQLNQMIQRTYMLLKEKGRIPNAPPSLQRGKRLMVTYISPAARAQLAIKANEIGRYLSEITPLIQVYPGIVDKVDFDKLAAKLAEFRSMTRTVLRTDAEVAKIRADRQQQQQMQQMAEVAEPLTKSMKNVADAQDKGLNLTGML
ncbi:MAG TPA: portal protein [Nitrospira sp.]|nr:portal protein [Nitrospira sp.]